jgi:peptidyl-prolyl cis-trans isomerase B (cyclophilin B)
LRTELGDIHLQFYEELAPQHTNNFLTLAVLGAYNGTAFDYVYGGHPSPIGIRGGDPYTFFYNDPLKKQHIARWGQGGLGVEQPPEEARARVQHDAGTVSSLRDIEGDWDNAIVFRIATDRDRELDRRYTPFAVVVEGMDVVNKIATSRKLAGEHSTYRHLAEFRTLERNSLLVEPVLIHKVVVYRDGAADPKEHKFPLEDGEQKISGLASTPAAALPEEVIYGGRSLLDVEEATGETKPRFGLNFPYPTDLSAKNRDPEKESPSPKGERTKNLVKPKDDGEPSDSGKPDESDG